MSFIATLYVNSAQAIWPLDEVPRLTAAALTPIPDYEVPKGIELLRVDRSNGHETCSALTAKDKKLVAKQCKALGLPSLLEFTTCEGIGPHLEVFNTAPSRPEWLLGYMPPPDPFHVQRVARFVDEESHAKALEKAIHRGEIVQRLSNGTVLDGHIKIQGAVLARHDLEKFCASLLIDVRDKDTRPVFDIPVRPLAIPDALQALPSDTEVRHNHAPCAGWSGGGAGKASDLINSIREVIDRQAAGRFTLREAAQIVADEHSIDAQWLLRRMTTAIDSPIQDERLKVYGVDTRVARLPGEGVSRWGDYVKAPEFNLWLATVADGLDLPLKEASPTHDTVSAFIAETKAREAERSDERAVTGWHFLDEAAADITRQRGLDESFAVSLLELMKDAVTDRLLEACDAAHKLPVPRGTPGCDTQMVRRESVNKWLSKTPAGYLWEGEQDAQPKTEQDRQSVPGQGVKEARQAHRYQMCIDAELAMPRDDYGPMPRGIGALARKLGITRQAFTEDVKAHIARLNGKQ